MWGPSGHDLRYAIDASKINTELGWKPSVTLSKDLKNTSELVFENQTWLNITVGSIQLLREAILIYRRFHGCLNYTGNEQTTIRRRNL
jgi:hypothetical protein